MTVECRDAKSYGTIILAHKGYFNKASESFYKENSIDACRASGVKEYIDIIELDVRKSKDGVLYCYHGTLIEYHVVLKIPKPFSSIREAYKADSLADILDVIPENKSVFLDIKDTSITRDDLLVVFQGRNFKEVILGNKSPRFLSRFDPLPLRFSKILNGNVLCGLYDLRNLKRQGFKYYEPVFPFQVTKGEVIRAEQAGLQFRCSGLFFRSKGSYWKKIEVCGIKHVSSDFI